MNLQDQLALITNKKSDLISKYFLGIIRKIFPVAIRQQKKNAEAHKQKRQRKGHLKDERRSLGVEKSQLRYKLTPVNHNAAKK
jgi:hypothetical protein